MHRTSNLARAMTLALGLIAALSVFAACGESGASENGEPADDETPPTSTEPESSPEASPTGTEEAENPFAGVPGIVDPDNRGWPREVEGMNGVVEIESKPERVHSLSLGFDEVIFALVPAERVAAVGSSTQNPDYSNVADVADGLPVVEREPEQVVAQEPDLVLAAPYHEAPLIEAMENAGLAVVQAEQQNDPEGRIADILLLGYMLGEEERALELADEVEARHQSLAEVTQAKPEEARPRVLSVTSYSGTVYTAGSGSTEGGIIEAAGGINAAADGGLEGNPETSMEGIVSLEPEVIVIPQASGGEEFRDELLENPALASVPAIEDGEVHVVPSRYFTTLSFWNLRGAEELAKLLWPEDLGGETFPPFSMPAGAE